MKKFNRCYNGSPWIMAFFIALVIAVAGCKKKTNPPEERPRAGESPDSLVLLPEEEDPIVVNVFPAEKFQAIANFGASDCWAVQHVGKWPASKTSVMADWLFSMDTTEKGQPLGIGLSAWRFNIGAGSAAQGDESGIEDEWRRSSSFLNENGSYNWNAQPGQQWFLKAAAERGVGQFIGFANSPPVQFTKNGKAFGSAASPENIAVSELPEFAAFLANVAEGIKNNTGIELSYISPVNEPQWDWASGSQEGCYMTNNTFLSLVVLLDQQLNGKSGLNTKILVTESGTWAYLYGEGTTVGDQIQSFFGPGSPVGNASTLARIIAGHSYYTTTPPASMTLIREQVWNKASSINDLAVWSTEYCPLGNGDLQALGWNSWKKDLGMDVALHVAGIIHHDLVYANASSWQWWLAISPYDYPDGLIYVSKSTSNGTFVDSKLMWALGNYSRFIRPGARRLKTVFSEDDLYVTSFSNAESQTISIVVVNASESTKPLRINLSGSEHTMATPYITSGKETHKLLPMKKIDLLNGFELPPRCIITFNLIDQ